MLMIRSKFSVSSKKLLCVGGTTLTLLIAANANSATCDQDRDTQTVRIEDKNGNEIGSIPAPIRKSDTGDLKASVAKIPEATQESEKLVFDASDLIPGISIRNKEAIYYNGPATGGWISFGPYYEINGVKTSIQPEITISTDWQPDQREVCTKHKFNPGSGSRKCVAKGVEVAETSFYLDVAADSGKTVLFRHVFTNLNDLDQATIYLPKFNCKGSVGGIEVRVADLTGGYINGFEVHNVAINGFWDTK